MEVYPKISASNGFLFVPPPFIVPFFSQQSDLGVREGLMHIIPYLTFGDPRTMTTLLKTFTPYLNFETWVALPQPPCTAQNHTHPVFAGLTRTTRPKKHSTWIVSVWLPTALEWVAAACSACLLAPVWGYCVVVVEEWSTPPLCIVACIWQSCLCCVPFQNDASGEKLKDLAIEMGLTTSAVAYLKGKVPPKRCPHLHPAFLSILN